MLLGGSIYDVIIVGAGPAGMTSGIYTSRRNLKTLILSKVLGGQVINCPRVENYPGFKAVEGLELMKNFEEQVKGFGVEIIYQGVEEIKEENGKFIVKTMGKEYESKTVILAFGKTPKKLNVPGEKEFQGKGVSYCATCDAYFFKGKIVAVVGGGNAALDAALLLSGIVKKVYLIHRRDKFRGFESMIREVKNRENIEFILDSVVTEILGEDVMKSLNIKNVKTEETKKLDVDGVFIEIGSVVKTDLVKDLVKFDKYNYIVINNNCETFYPSTDNIRPGIFAAGDITNTPFKQIIVASGEGAKAGLQVYNYIHGIKSQVLITDWKKTMK